MQDGAWPHRIHDVFDFLDEYFDDRVIATSKRGSTVKRKGMDWLPYLPIQGPLKDIVYQINPLTLGEFEEAICQAYMSIPGHRVIDNFIVCFDILVLLHKRWTF